MSIPRISFPGITALSPIAVRRPPSAWDPIDATRLTLRLAALGSVLDDLPAQARRFARWRCRVAAQIEEQRSSGRRVVRRVWPLRPGRPPGRCPVRNRRAAHEVHDILADVHGLAFWVMESRDTS